MIPWLASLAGSAALALAWYGTERISRPPRLRSPETPSDCGMPFSEVVFPSADGIPLHGWRIPGHEPTATIIVCHGYGVHKADGLDCAAFLRSSFDVFLFDFRAHGQSGGDRTSLGYLECRDVAGAVRYLEGQSAGPLGVLGYSMGAAAAILAAAQLPKLRAVVADTPFVRLREALFCGLRRQGYPAAFSRLVCGLLAATLRWRTGSPPGSGDPINAVPAIAPRPLFLIHGALDGYIPVWHSRALYAAARDPKRLWLVDGADHCDAHHCTGPAYELEVLRFFRAALRESAGASARPWNR